MQRSCSDKTFGRHHRVCLHFLTADSVNAVFRHFCLQCDLNTDHIFRNRHIFIYIGVVETCAVSDRIGQILQKVHT